MSSKIPAGYRWEVTAFGDEEGLTINVTLVDSPFKEGSFRNRLFSRPIITASAETELTATDEEIDEATETVKKQLASMFFRRL